MSIQYTKLWITKMRHICDETSDCGKRGSLDKSSNLTEPRYIHCAKQSNAAKQYRISIKEIKEIHKALGSNPSRNPKVFSFVLFLRLLKHVFVASIPFFVRVFLLQIVNSRCIASIGALKPVY